MCSRKPALIDRHCLFPVAAHLEPDLLRRHLPLGRDTRFAFIFDVGTIWLVGVPMAALAAFVLHLPVHWVYLFVMSDELTKSIAGVIRLVSKKWIHDLTTTV